MPSVLDKNTAEIASLAAETRQLADALQSAPATANMIRTLSERYGRLLSALASENRQLQATLEQTKREVAALRRGDEPEDDTRFFGTHIREAWHVITGR